MLQYNPLVGDFIPKIEAFLLEISQEPMGIMGVPTFAQNTRTIIEHLDIILDHLNKNKQKIIKFLDEIKLKSAGIDPGKQKEQQEEEILETGNPEKPGQLEMSKSGPEKPEIEEISRFGLNRSGNREGNGDDGLLEKKVEKEKESGRKTVEEKKEENGRKSVGDKKEENGVKKDEIGQIQGKLNGSGEINLKLLETSTTTNMENQSFQLTPPEHNSTENITEKKSPS